MLFQIIPCERVPWCFLHYSCVVAAYFSSNIPETLMHRFVVHVRVETGAFVQLLHCNSLIGDEFTSARSSLWQFGTAAYWDRDVEYSRSSRQIRENVCGYPWHDTAKSTVEEIGADFETPRFPSQHQSNTCCSCQEAHFRKNNHAPNLDSILSSLKLRHSENN